MTKLLIIAALALSLGGCGGWMRDENWGGLSRGVGEIIRQ